MAIQGPFRCDSNRGFRGCQSAFRSGDDPGRSTEGRGKKEIHEASNELFGLTRVHAFHLRFSSEEWEKMQKVRTQPLFPVPKKPSEPEIEANVGGSFGFIFPYAKAAFEVGEKTFENVGIRYKGGGSYVTSSGRLQRNVKVELDRYDEAQSFGGLKTVTLNSESADPTKLREVLGYAIYRAAGVPAPRTAFAEVTLTVPGKYETSSWACTRWSNTSTKRFSSTI